MCQHVFAKSFLSEKRLHLAALVCAALLSMMQSRPAHAHQASLTHATAEVAQDQKKVFYRIELKAPDVAEAIGLPPDTTPSAAEVESGKELLLRYLWERIEVGGQSAQCAPQQQAAHVAREVARGEEIVVASFSVDCSAPITTLVIEYHLFFDIDPLHRGLLRVRYGAEDAVVELRPDANRLVWDLGEPPPSSLYDFVVSGVEHILFGFDHIAFLLSLLVVAAIVRESSGTWHTRGFKSGLRYTAIIVTSFTVAHSITLIAASLDLIVLSSRLVESIIAASIVYVAVENIVYPQAQRRPLVTFAFGLVHGLGFASMLKVLLPDGNVVPPLLMFNVGVELGQLAVVALVLPVLHLIAARLGAARYRRWLVPTWSAALAALGAIWLAERALDITILGL